MSLDVLCIGESMVSLAPQPVGRLQDAGALAVHTAGAESNVAMAVSALGSRAGWLSRVGDDPFGELVLGRIRAAGVDVSRVKRRAGLPTGLMAKDPGAMAALPATGPAGTPDLTGAAAQGTTVYYYRQGSAAASMGLDMVHDVRSLHPAVIHLSALAVDVVEPVGAGDAFAAGWLVGLLRELPAWKRLRLGHLCAAHTMLSADDRALLPAADELDSLVNTSDRTWRMLHLNATRPVPAGLVPNG